MEFCLEYYDKIFWYFFFYFKIYGFKMFEELIFLISCKRVCKT